MDDKERARTDSVRALSVLLFVCLIRTAYPIETPDLFVPWTLSFQRVKPEYPQPISAARA